MSNGFSAADMSTAAANGHADGYQAGYADAVKAVEVGKPAAAQEAVAWQVGDDFYTSESLAIEGIQQWGPSGSIAIPLYAAPVAAAPVECGNCHDGKSDMDHDCPKCSGTGVLASTPAAPGIDLRSAILQLRDDALHMKDPGDTVNAYDRVLRLIDASPKGGSCVVTDAMVNAALRVQYARAGSVWTGTEANPDFVDMRNVLTAAMQATSAEVGS